MHSVLPVLSLLIAQTGSGQGLQATSPAELHAGVSGSHFSQGKSYDGLEGGGSAGATWYFWRPIVDDQTPLSMQSYLQRLSFISLSAGGSRLSGRNGYPRYQYDAASLVASSSGVVYLGDVILGGGFTYERLDDIEQSDALADDVRHTVRYGAASLTCGVRLGDFDVAGTYLRKRASIDGANTKTNWGQARLRIRSALDNDLFGELDVYTLSEGGGLSLSSEMFTEPTLGLWFRGYLEEGALYVNSTHDYVHLGAEVGVGWWASRRLEYQFSLGVSSASRTGGDYDATTTTTATFGIVLRAPIRHRPQPEPVDQSGT